MLVNMGVTGGISKETDDAAQLLIEAIVSSATDVSTAGTARIAGACASGLFLLTRHGRDVVLPKFTEIDIMFDRPASLGATQPLPAAENSKQTQTGTWNMETSKPLEVPALQDIIRISGPLPITPTL